VVSKHDAKNGAFYTTYLVSQKPSWINCFDLGFGVCNSCGSLFGVCWGGIIWFVMDVVRSGIQRLVHLLQFASADIGQPTLILEMKSRLNDVWGAER
jgi:hypothetical protein